MICEGRQPGCAARAPGEQSRFIIVPGNKRNETCGSAVDTAAWRRPLESPRLQWVEHEESDMTSQAQIHVIARQMLEQQGPGAIATAAQNALACERKGDADEAKEWRHVEDAMKMMRGPHQS